MSDKAKSTPGCIRACFDDPDDPDRTALHIERYLNFAISLVEFQFRALRR
ncbi:MAG: hypothetical protein J7483_07005 [Novosphingobium sp.]|nr:hypothetical protein [Novosphingobium sp.]